MVHTYIYIYIYIDPYIEFHLDQWKEYKKCISYYKSLSNTAFMNNNNDNNNNNNNNDLYLIATIFVGEATPPLPPDRNRATNTQTLAGFTQNYQER